MFSQEIGAWIAVRSEDGRPRLRISRDEAGEDIVESSPEAARTARAALDLEVKAREKAEALAAAAAAKAEAAAARAEDAEARLAELESRLRALQQEK